MNSRRETLREPYPKVPGMPWPAPPDGRGNLEKGTPIGVPHLKHRLTLVSGSTKPERGLKKTKRSKEPEKKEDQA